MLYSNSKFTFKWNYYLANTNPFTIFTSLHGFSKIIVNQIIRTTRFELIKTIVFITGGPLTPGTPFNPLGPVRPCKERSKVEL